VSAFVARPSMSAAIAPQRSLFRMDVTLCQIMT
jgi:hypothetical protein